VGKQPFFTSSLWVSCGKLRVFLGKTLGKRGLTRGNLLEKARFSSGKHLENCVFTFPLSYIYMHTPFLMENWHKKN